MKSIPFSDVREYYHRHQPDGHWFDAGAISFFCTKLPSVAYEGDAGLLFITRETDPRHRTMFSIRRQHVNGDIDTVGEFHSFVTHASALAQVKVLHKTAIYTAAKDLGKLHIIHVGD
jgi:hypothetical protein